MNKARLQKSYKRHNEFMQSQIPKIQWEWAGIVRGEELSVEVLGGVAYGFSSELGCLRLYQAYEGDGVVDYSENRKTWFFRKGHN